MNDENLTLSNLVILYFRRFLTKIKDRGCWNPFNSQKPSTGKDIISNYLCYECFLIQLPLSGMKKEKIRTKSKLLYSFFRIENIYG